MQPSNIITTILINTTIISTVIFVTVAVIVSVEFAKSLSVPYAGPVRFCSMFHASYASLSIAFPQQSRRQLAAFVQVLQLRSATSSQRSPAVDYQAGIEAMVLAILQQTNYSQHVGLATLASLTVQTSQDRAAQDGLQLAAYSAFLNNALDANANLTATVQTSLLNITSARSALPVSQQASTFEMK